MDVMFHNHSLDWTDWPTWKHGMGPYFTDNYTYDYIYPFNHTHGLRAWFDGEHTAYNTAFAHYHSSVLLAAGSDTGVTAFTYHLARWQKPFAGVQPPGDDRVIRIRDLDFYTLDGDRFSYNWCMVDVVHILQQGGYHVLPPSPLGEDGLYPAPNAMDGNPAPDSNFTDPAAAALSEAPFRGMLKEDLA